MALPVNYTDLDAEVHIGDTQAQVLTWTAWGLEVVLPPLPTGLHGISVSINRVRIGAQGWGGVFLLILGLFNGLVIQSTNSGFALVLCFPPLLKLRDKHVRIITAEQVLGTLQDSFLPRPVQGKFLAYELGKGELSGTEMSCLLAGLGWRGHLYVRGVCLIRPLITLCLELWIKGFLYHTSCAQSSLPWSPPAQYSSESSYASIQKVAKLYDIVVFMLSWHRRMSHRAFLLHHFPSSLVDGALHACSPSAPFSLLLSPVHASLLSCAFLSLFLTLSYFRTPSPFSAGWTCTSSTSQKSSASSLAVGPFWVSGSDVTISIYSASLLLGC